MSAAYFIAPTPLDLGQCPELEAGVSHDTVNPARQAVLRGGRQGIVLQAHRLRENRGDAEQYAWSRIWALAQSEPGILGVEDALGRRSTWSGCRCTGAFATVEGERLAVLGYRFLAPRTAVQPPWQAPPDAPPARPGTSTLLNYEVDGVPLGDRADGLHMEMTRTCPVRPVPRALGARTGPPPAPPVLRITVTGRLHRPAEHLPRALAELLGSLDPGPVTLTGNGNTYPGLRLERCTPLRRGPSDLQFDCTFLQEIPI